MLSKVHVKKRPLASLREGRLGKLFPHLLKPSRTVLLRQSSVWPTNRSQESMVGGRERYHDVSTIDEAPD